MRQTGFMSLPALPTFLLLPPMNLLLLAGAGAYWHRRRGGRIALWGALAGLLVLALPMVADVLTASLERGVLDPPLAGAPSPGAIVVLTAGETRVLRDGKPVYAVDALSLEREAAAAALARRTGLPLLVSGGVVKIGSPALAALMADSLANDFATATKWREVGSVDTWQNAADSSVILRAAGITRVYVVTHGWHMRRALIAFRAAGLDPVAAPVAVDAGPVFAAEELIPSAHAWLRSYYALHEWLGVLWYDAKA